MTRPDDRVDGLDNALQAIRDLPVYAPPADVWRGIERELDRASVTDHVRVPRRIEPLMRPAAAERSAWARRVRAAAIATTIIGVGSSYALGLYRSSWSVKRVAGAPVAGARAVSAIGTLGEGEWLETDGSSRARLSIGALGSADVGPDSRVQLVQAGGTERALRMERGSIEARVWAPPRFFLVETPAATAIDLGCVYSLAVDAEGNGTLVVRSGQVELNGRGLRSLVVAGTAAQMRPGVGPGTPYSTGEPQPFRDALAVVDFGGEGRSAALERVLEASGVGSTITLWHLLRRVPVAERARVYDRLSALAPPPAGVTRSAVLSLDVRALDRWRVVLEPSWSTERVRMWKRAWRAFWSVARGL